MSSSWEYFKRRPDGNYDAYQWGTIAALLPFGMYILNSTHGDILVLNGLLSYFMFWIALFAGGIITLIRPVTYFTVRTGTWFNYDYTTKEIPTSLFRWGANLGAVVLMTGLLYYFYIPEAAKILITSFSKDIPQQITLTKDHHIVRGGRHTTYAYCFNAPQFTHANGLVDEYCVTQNEYNAQAEICSKSFRTNISWFGTVYHGND